eukprot:1147121-Pelagomonas_calceolata.AAC.1
MLRARKQVSCAGRNRWVLAENPTDGAFLSAAERGRQEGWIVRWKCPDRGRLFHVALPGA